MSPYCIQVELKVKRYFTTAYFMPVKPFTTAAGPMKVCDSPWSDVPMRAFIQEEEDILSICYEL
jgi:hypothetical protein